MECQTVERLGRLEKHWEHVGSERVNRSDVWVWVVERVGSECKHVGLEYEYVDSASWMEHVGSKSERVDSLVCEGVGAIQCLGVQQSNSGHLIYGSSHLTTGLLCELK